MSLSKMQRGLVAALLTGSCLATIAPAFAQIEEIVVTTRKRAENLQDVPIAITALTAEVMQRKGIEDLADIAKYTTGVILDSAFSKQDTRIVIRGLSPTRGRQNVAVLQDDVDISSLAINTAGGSMLINPRLFDTERVEIVKGPHSALYGRQAFNGAINYITKKPGDTFEANVSADVASYGKYEAKGSISGPLLADKLMFGLNASGWNFDGFYKSAITGAHLGGGNGKGVAGTLVFTPTYILKFTLRSEYSKDHFDPEARVNKIPSTAVTLPATASGGFLTTATTQVINTGSVGSLGDYPGGFTPSTNPRTGVDYPGFDRDIWRSSLRSEANFENFSIISLSHYGETHDTTFIDQFAEGDLSNPAINANQEVHFVNKNRLVSEDLRVQTNTTGPLSATLGGLFWNETTRQNNQSLNCLSTAGNCVNVVRAIGTTYPYDSVQPNLLLRDTHHYSIYALAEYKVTDALRVSGEVRHTWEAEKIRAASVQSPIIGCVSGFRVTGAGGALACGLGTLPQATASAFLVSTTKSSFWTPRVTIDYKITPEALLYASAAEGKKPGGISLVNGAFNPTTNKYLPEKMWVYELGAKTEWLEKRLLLNVAGFYQDYTDKQLSGTQIDPVTQLPVSYTSNASSAHVYGLELEGTAVLTEHLTANLGYTYLKTKYSKFSLLNSTLYNVARAGNCTQYTAANGTKYCTNDFTGNQLENAPKHSLQFGAQYKNSLTSSIDWFAEFDAHYQSKRFVDYYNALYYDSFWNVDIRAGLQSAKWSLTAYLNNALGDKTIRTGINDFPDFNRSFINSFGSLGYIFQGTAPDRRQVGLRATYKY